MAVLDLDEALAESLGQAVGIDLEGPLYGLHRIAMEPFPNFVLVERLRTVHGGAQHLDGSIACRGMIVGVLLEHRLVVLDELLVARRLEARPPTGIRDDAVGKRP